MGIRIDANGTEAVSNTLTTIASGNGLIHQPAFSVDGVIFRPDVYDIDNAELTDIKSTTKVKSSHVLDLAINMAAAMQNGVAIERTSVMHLNPEFRCGNGLQKLVRKDITAEVLAVVDSFDLREEIRRLRDGVLPEPVLSRACKACPYINQCYEDPSDLIIRIPRLSTARLEEFVSLGLLTLNDLRQRPDVIERMTQKQRVFIEANRDDGHFEATPDIDALSGVGWLNEDVIGHLDFETCAIALPTRHGEGPYAHSVTQFSFTVDSDQGLQEQGFLSDGSDDRESLVVRLLEVATGSYPVVVHNIGFERSRLRELGHHFPEHSAALQALSNRLVDLEPVIKAALPGLGSSSLKAVAPLAQPGFGYKDLSIQNGELASAVFGLLRTSGGCESVQQEIGLDVEKAREALLDYCARDTLATAVVVRWFRRIRNAAVGLP